MSVSVAGMLQAGQEPVAEASIVKDVGTIWEQKLPERVRDLSAFLEPEASNRVALDEQLDRGAPHDLPRVQRAAGRDRQRFHRLVVLPAQA